MDTGVLVVLVGVEVTVGVGVGCTEGTTDGVVTGFGVGVVVVFGVGEVCPPSARGAVDPVDLGFTLDTLFCGVGFGEIGEIFDGVTLSGNKSWGMRSSTLARIDDFTGTGK